MYVISVYVTGDSGTLYDSVHNKILSLPPDFSLYPGHDYTGMKYFILDLAQMKLEWEGILGSADSQTGDMSVGEMLCLTQLQQFSSHLEETCYT